jgi:ribosome-associated translation inhibitor RaiA
MRITVSGLSFELTDAIARHVEDRIRVSLGTASDRINAVSVRLSDINGSRGGIDKRCRIAVWMRHLRTVVVEAIDPDLYIAVDDAASRAKQAIWRGIKRRRTLRREYANRALRPVLA